VSELKANLEALRLREEAPKASRAKWVALAAAVLLLGAGGLWWARASAAVEVETVRAAVQQPAQAQAGAPILTASGYVVARRKAVVSAKIQGRLADLRVEEGSRVVEGETIARLESADYEANLVRAKARVESVRLQIEAAAARVRSAEVNLTEARRQASVAQRLWAEKVGSVDERDATQARVASAEAALASAQADHASSRSELAQAEAEVRLNEALFNNTIIRAPFTGTVVRKMAEVGESVAPIPPGVNISTASGAIVALADLDTLEVEVDVAESNVAKLKSDQPAEVVVEAFPDKKYRAVLRQVIPTADRTRATVMVKVTILDKDPDLKPEMSARATFLEKTAGTTTGAAPAPRVFVPQLAVVTRDGKSQVFEVKPDNVVRLRAVTVGPAQQGQVLVKEGLTGSEVLVKQPADTLKDGDAVKVKG
jgi:RND family efflux transporter MFP subunit